jgi:hypothetical protein
MKGILLLLKDTVETCNLMLRKFQGFLSGTCPQCTTYNRECGCLLRCSGVQHRAVW